MRLTRVMVCFETNRARLQYVHWISRPMKTRLLALSLSLLFATTTVHAGPCSQSIDRVQAQIDARLEATAAAGKTARQSLAADQSHQPTPASIAAAEAALGEGAGNQTALAALSRARRSDQAGDAARCKKAVRQAMRALKR